MSPPQGGQQGLGGDRGVSDPKVGKPECWGKPPATHPPRPQMGAGVAGGTPAQPEPPPSIPWEVQSLSSTPSQPPHTQGGAPHLGDPPLETPKTRQRLQARRGNAFIVAKASVGQLPAGGGTRPREGGGHGGHRLGWEGARASPQGSPQGPTLCRIRGESSACSWGLHQGGQEGGGGAGGAPAEPAWALSPIVLWWAVGPEPPSSAATLSPWEPSPRSPSCSHGGRDLGRGRRRWTAAMLSLGGQGGPAAMACPPAPSRGHGGGGPGCPLVHSASIGVSSRSGDGDMG